MIRKILLRSLGAVLAVGVWWYATEVQAAESPILANMGPQDALNSLLAGLGDGTLIKAAAVSLERLGNGLLIAIVAGVVLGVVIGSNRTVEALGSVPIQFLRMISPLAWMPIAVVLFGIGGPPVVFLVAIAAVWPVVVSTAAGVRALDPRWILLARSLGANGWERIREIVVPGVRGHVLTGVRLALGVAWIVIVPAEMLGVDSGLGYAILNARDQLAYDQLAGVMLLIGVLGFSMDWLAQTAFKRWVQ